MTPTLRTLRRPEPGRSDTRHRPGAAPARWPRPAAILGATTLVLAACTAPVSTTPDEVAGEISPETEAASDGASAAVEAAAAQPRIVATYDGGLLVVDGLDLAVLADVELPGFNRLGPYGDQRHVLVATTQGAEPGFRALDTGAWSTTHGDHSHHFTGEPGLTDITFPAAAPGHAIPHGGLTVLFDDATGDIHLVDPTDDLGEGRPETRTLTSPAAHHGFALAVDGSTLVATVGDDEQRTGLRVLDHDGTERVRDESCPGVHGEAIVHAQDDAHTPRVLAGCEDGVLMWTADEFTKVTSPDGFGRIGNLYVTHDSTVALGDYKHDPDQGLALHEVTLLDTDTAALAVVDLPDGVEYTWRGLGRSPDGRALVLGTDGALHVIDERSGGLIASHPVIEPWEAPEEWQSAHPSLTVLGETAYVTSPADRRIHAVDIPTGEVFRTGELPAAPNEVLAVTG